MNGVERIVVQSVISAVLCESRCWCYVQAWRWVTSTMVLVGVVEGRAVSVLVEVVDVHQSVLLAAAYHPIKQTVCVHKMC